ncbi:MAG: glycosyltransferase family 2 protein [Cytophagaceae bacterium]|nr:glycosyltransferase family 2 protein [Cytophagaceae bacterium]
MNIKLSIVVPCYNEARNIPLILDRFAQVIQRQDVEVVLVNNGSTDASAEVLQQLLPAYPFARTVLVPINQGYGFGILSGLKACRGEFIGWTHADMQTDPKDVIRALEIIEKENNPQTTMVKGLRKKRPFSDAFFTVGMSVFESLYLGKALWDINAQPNIFHRTFFANWPQAPHDFSLDLFVLYQARKNNLRVIRFPVLFKARLHGHSSWNTGLKSKWKFIKRTLEFSTKLKKNL